MKNILIIIFILLSYFNFLKAQSWNDKAHLTHDDTLKGSNTDERKWWNLLHYNITLQPDFITKSLSGKNRIMFKTIDTLHSSLMQIDLQYPLRIDSAIYNNAKIPIRNIHNVWYLDFANISISTIDSVDVFYSGKPYEAISPPWDGGWVWTKDSLGRPWMTIACQGIGASVWLPCKDIQSDEPDLGVDLTIIVSDTLVGIGNGRLKSIQKFNNKITAYSWAVANPINNYGICPYIGKYVNLYECYNGIKGSLDVNYWILDYNVAKAKTHLFPQVNLMLNSFEKWFGPYPFYEDGYKIVDAPNYGMEHQSNIAYGNGYVNGNHGVDYSGTGVGMKWDFLVIHESAHEWFGNSITSNDPADKWIHESFACYADVLFMDDYFGDKAATSYVIGTRNNIKNDETITGPYNVSKEGGSDMYPKGRNFLHMIRAIINNDENFRKMLIAMNRKFYHQTVSSRQVENFINGYSGIDFSKVFDQYLRTTKIPTFEYKISHNELKYRFTNSVENFHMPIRISNLSMMWLYPTTQWQVLKMVNPPSKIIVDQVFYINSLRN